MKLFYFTILLLMNFAVKADVCQTLVLDKNAKDYEVTASATKGLHIKFYEDLKFSILSNDVLWKPHASNNMPSHFWLFSKNMSVENNKVGVTFIMDSGRSINLVVQQDLDSPSCLVIEDSLNNALVAVDYTKPVKNLPSIPMPLVTSSYQFDKSLVRSAHDDSRFTHVQLNGFSTGASIHSVIAINDGVKHVISNPSFDSLSNTYTLPGIHDELLFDNGSSSFVVSRF